MEEQENAEEFCGMPSSGPDTAVTPTHSSIGNLHKTCIIQSYLLLNEFVTELDQPMFTPTLGYFLLNSKYFT